MNTPISRSLIASLTGNILEWYDFGLFIYLAPILSQHYFPFAAGSHPLLAFFLVFAAGFIMRPIGALIFGHFGDHYGRTCTLRFSIFSVTSLAFVSAILPDRSQIGLTATLLMLVIRLLQGLCLGGEFAGSMVYLSEMATNNRKSFYSCLTNNGSNIGLLCATGTIALLQSILGNTEFVAWGWRLTFALGGLFGLLSFFMRYYFIESNEFLEVQEKKKIHRYPFFVLWRLHKSELMIACALMCMTASGCYTFMNIMSTYLHDTLHWPLSQALSVQSTFLMASLFLIPFAGHLSDRYGNLRLLKIAIAGYIIFSIPCYYLLSEFSHILLLAPMMLCFVLEQGTIPATLSQLFPIEVRYTAVSLSYNTTAALVGGSAPFVNFWLIEHTHLPWALAWHLVICASVAGFGLWYLLERRRNDSDATDKWLVVHH